MAAAKPAAGHLHDPMRPSAPNMPILASGKPVLQAMYHRGHEGANCFSLASALSSAMHWQACMGNSWAAGYGKCLGAYTPGGTRLQLRQREVLPCWCRSSRPLQNRSCMMRCQCKHLHGKRTTMQTGANW
jgi:hypothetical protein